MRKRKKKKGTIRFIFFALCLLGLSIFAGMKIGKYYSAKNLKPIGQNNSALSGIKSGAASGANYMLSEDDKVNLTSTVYEFLNAEHKKRNDRLAVVVDQGYYDTLLKDMKNLKTGDVTVQDINFQGEKGTTQKVEVTYLKFSKTYTETITFKKSNDTWKVSMVER